MGFLDFIKNNLSHVLPILIVGAVGLAIIIERVRALYRVYPIPDASKFFGRISELVKTGKLNEAQGLCDSYPTSTIPKIVKTAIARAHLPESIIEDGLRLSVNEATQAIQKRIGFLSTIANVATLLGLFGTILGLIQSFEAVGHADAQQKSALLSIGISTAMNATMLGLGVAIPCMIAFSFLVNQSNRLISETENASVRILDILKQRYYTVDDQSLKNSEHNSVHPSRENL